jgi:ditrans,polycis-polyprenyl diphosphate synthase
MVHRLFAHLTALLIFIVSLGPIPQHVAFVMDGNRRYARGKGRKVWDGHTEGFESLKRVSHGSYRGVADDQILEICLKLKVRAVTVYAFSIDNFKRTEEEVDALMGLAKVKLSELARHG